MAIKPQTMRKVRQVHQYIALFFAPMILLFAFSGALQTFGFHESHDPGTPAPRGWIVWLASVHKNQTLPRVREEEHEHAGPQRPPAAGPRRPDEAPADRPSPFPLKVFVGLLSIGLILSTLLGITIALNNRSTRRTSLALLGVGIVLPLLLLYV